MTGLAASKKNDPASEWVTITPGAGAITDPIRGIFAGGDGTITVESEGGRSATFAMSTGTLLPIRPYKVTAATVSPVIGVW